MIVIADLHLGKVQDTIEKEGLPSRVFDARARVREAIALAQKTNGELAIAGDVFDSSHPAPYLIDLFINLMEEANEKLRAVWIIPGNHDCGAHYHSMPYMEDLLDNVRLISEPQGRYISIGKKKLAVAFLPHVPKDKMEAMVKKYGSYLNWALKCVEGEKIDIVIGHAHLTGAKVGSDIEIEAGEAIHFKGSDFFKYKVGVFGHIHQHQEIGKNIYVGPVVTNTFSEAEYIKGVIQIHEDLETAFIPYKTPEMKYRKVTINLVDKDSVDLDAERLAKIGKGKLLKIVVYARSMMQVHENEIRGAFNKAGGQVMRFEVILCDKMGEIEETEIESVVEEINYQPVLASWLRSKKLGSKDLLLATTLGNEVIEEVLNAQRAEM